MALRVPNSQSRKAMKPIIVILKARVEPTRAESAPFVGVAGAVGVVPEPADVLELEVVELERFASSRKVAKLFGPDSTALIANTIPAAQ
jgi:hypothetical protein